MSAAAMGLVASEAQEIAQAFELAADGQALKLTHHVLYIFGNFSAAGVEDLVVEGRLQPGVLCD